MHTDEELTLRSLAVLKEVLLTGCATDLSAAVELLNRGMIRPLDDLRMELTGHGRALLVRGSPALWSMTA